MFDFFGDLFGSNDGSNAPKPLTYCGQCETDFVIPIMDECHPTYDDPDDSMNTGWHMLLYCVNCGYEREVDVSQEEAEAFDETLDAGIFEVKLAAARFTQEAMEAELEVFVAALEADAILPEDF